jgi:hypothetical protein
MLRPASLDDLTPAQRATLPIVLRELSGEDLSPDEAWEYDDFGADVRIWVFEEAGEARYELWGGAGGMDAVLVDVGPGRPRPAGAAIVQHELQNLAMDPARFAEVEAAWSARTKARGAKAKPKPEASTKKPAPRKPSGKKPAPKKPAAKAQPRRPAAPGLTVAELTALLEADVAGVMAFMDYEPTIESEEELASTLDAWTGSKKWRQTGHRFEHLGIDGTGGQFAAWHRPGAEGPPPVVLFDSEGGRGVLASSPARWAQVVAHAPAITFAQEPVRAVKREGELGQHRDDPESEEEARAALEAYRAAVEKKLGKLPPLKELTGDLEKLNKEFLAWVQAAVG